MVFRILKSEEKGMPGILKNDPNRLSRSLWGEISQLSERADRECKDRIWVFIVPILCVIIASCFWMIFWQTGFHPEAE